MTTQLQRSILSAIAQHGPLTFGEASQALGGAFTWSDVHDAIRALQRSGHVLVFHDDRVRLTLSGRRLAAEAV